jgi:hypothetical protein
MSALESLINLLVDGIAPEIAVRLVEAQQPFDHARIQYFVRIPDLAQLPSAQCLTTHLPQDRKPTKEEVERAIAICLKENWPTT